MKQKQGCIRVASLEVTGLTDDDYKRWRNLGDTTRGIINATWQAWLVWHFQHSSEQKLREHFRRYREWEAADKKTRGDKPAWPVHAVPKECAKYTYDEVSRRFPEISTDSRELARNAVIQKIGHLKAAKGSLPGWVAVLFCNQSLPSTVRANPIPFSKKNAEIEPPAERTGQWKLHVRFTRVPVEGKKNGATVRDTVTLWSKGQKAAGQVAILRKITSGEYEFCGSSMVYSESKKKWFAQICYRDNSVVQKLDASRVAKLSAGPAYGRWPHPWIFRLPERRRAPGGDGRYVGSVRRKIMAERKSRQRGYRNAGSANKGHGRSRALQPTDHLQQRWKDFVKSLNHSVSRDVVNQCVEANCGTLIFVRPTRSAVTRFLSCVGKTDDRESSSWAWYQIETMLKYKCERAGINLVTRESKRSKAKGKKAA